MLPRSIRRSVETKDGSGRFLVGIYPSVTRGHGRNAMAFTEELYGLEIPAGVQGPVGEMPVFAEILWIVTGEGPWMVAATFLGIICIVLFGRRSLRQTGWVMFPLVGGLMLTLGIMAAAGLQLNFFNVVIIPALIGMGVDHGVHFYRRWKELGRRAAPAQRELFGPLSACTVTTMMGYAGMIFASHPGLQSIGHTACIGLGCIWLTSLALLPGLLDWYYQDYKESA
jgi:predicted RND superfamily exporter protein